MSCRRAFEIDLSAYAEHPRDAAFEAFRRHYPGCRDCSAELQIWTELLQGLERGAQAHPRPAELAAFAASSPPHPGAPPPPIARHLASCPSCRDELRAIARGAPAWPSDASAGAGPARFARAAQWLRRLLVQPAFAWGLVLLLSVPAWWGLFPRPQQRVLAPSLAEAPVPAAAPEALRERVDDVPLPARAAPAPSLPEHAPAAPLALAAKTAAQPLRVAVADGARRVIARADARGGLLLELAQPGSEVVRARLRATAAGREREVELRPAEAGAGAAEVLIASRAIEAAWLLPGVYELSWIAPQRSPLPDTAIASRFELAEQGSTAGPEASTDAAAGYSEASEARTALPAAEDRERAASRPEPTPPARFVIEIR